MGTWVPNGFLKPKWVFQKRRICIETQKFNTHTYNACIGNAHIPNISLWEGIKDWQIKGKNRNTNRSLKKDSKIQEGKERRAANKMNKRRLKRRLNVSEPSAKAQEPWAGQTSLGNGTDLLDKEKYSQQGAEGMQELHGGNQIKIFKKYSIYPLIRKDRKLILRKMSRMQRFECIRKKDKQEWRDIRMLYSTYVNIVF